MFLSSLHAFLLLTAHAMQLEVSCGADAMPAPEDSQALVEIEDAAAQEGHAPGIRKLAPLLLALTAPNVAEGFQVPGVVPRAPALERAQLAQMGADKFPKRPRKTRERGEPRAPERPSRRDLALGAAAASVPLMAGALVGSTNPANNYYFPTAKYRYLPRIQRAYLATDLAVPALQEGDWESVGVAYERMDNAITALPLYTNAVEGSRSSKKKKKSGLQKELAVLTKDYAAACDKLKIAVDRKDTAGARAALTTANIALNTYRDKAKINDESGGVLDPTEFASKSGSKVTGTGYVVPVFRGGATGLGLAESDYTLKRAPKASAGE